MLKLVARRLAVSLPLLFILATTSFFLVHMIPGDPARTIIGPGATAGQYHAFDAKLGLYRPLVDQYGHWLADVLHGDLGASWLTGQPVVSSIDQSMPVTLSLVLISTVVATITGVALGVVGAHQGGWVDGITNGISGLGLALPSFWLAVLLVIVFAIWLKVLPATGYTYFSASPTSWARDLILPVVALSAAGAASIARQARAAMQESLAKNYARALRGLGLSRRSILIKHALRNAASPIINTIGLQFIGMLGGAVIIEQVFALPGVGRLTLDAVTSHDVPMVQGVVLYLAFVILIVNLATDLLHGWLVPRSRAR